MFVAPNIAGLTPTASAGVSIVELLDAPYPSPRTAVIDNADDDDDATTEGKENARFSRMMNDEVIVANVATNNLLCNFAIACSASSSRFAVRLGGIPAYFQVLTSTMFSDKDIDYSLNRSCRTLSAVAPPSKSSSSSKVKIVADDINNDDGDNADNDWNDTDDLDDEDSDAAQLSSSHLFLVGTSIPSLSKVNEDNSDDVINVEEEEEEEEISSNSNKNRIHLLQYHEDSHELTEKSSYPHPTGEIWAMECHPTKPEWVVTCGGGAVYSTSDDESIRKNVQLSQFQTTLWRLLSDDITTMNDDDNDGGGYDDNLDTSQTLPKLEPITTIPHGKSISTTTGWEQRVGQIVWNPLLRPSNSSGDAMFDLAQTSSSSNSGNLITVGWDANISPISLWDISTLSDANVKEVWSTGTGSSQNSTKSNNGRLFGSKLANMHTSLPRRVSWDPHDTHNILATSGVDVVAYDMRVSASSSSSIIPSAHRYGVVDVCHNHSQSNIVLTAGMDGVIKFWDLRMSSSSSGSGKDNTLLSTLLPPPLLKAVRGGHSHWTTRAVYNPFHDQLVLSGGSDGIANLWRISSCSSAPFLELHDGDDEDGDGDLSQGSRYGDEIKNTDDAEDEDEDYMHSKESFENDNKENKGESSPKNESNSQDIRVTRHECSDVTADVAWSATDPWIYATLSYDGAIIVHHVPSKEKYKILL